MESNEIKEAAEKYADENNSAYTNDYYGFIAGAIWHQSQTSTLSKKLKEALDALEQIANGTEPATDIEACIWKDVAKQTAQEALQSLTQPK